MDRTQEFFSAVETISSGYLDRQRLIAPSNKTEFAKAASQIGKELNATMVKLQKLAQLAKKKSLFDDKPVEINELIFVIKQDIAKINRQISALQGYLKKNSSGANKQTEEHSTNVISTLQSKLASTSNEFRTVLELRTQNMKEQKTRRDEYSVQSQQQTPQTVPQQSALYQPYVTPPAYSETTSTSSVPAVPMYPNGVPIPGMPPLNEARHRGHSHTPATYSTGGGDAVIELGGGPSDGFGFGNVQQDMLLMQNSVNQEIIESRSQAIESIESTIAELGQIYQHFAQILGSQREAIQRIDDNVLDTEANVMNAHTELLRYYQNISSNRWLMIKIFSVVIFFFLVFTVFMQ